jgi:hypothetical protein
LDVTVDFTTPVTSSAGVSQVTFPRAMLSGASIADLTFDDPNVDVVPDYWPVHWHRNK